MDLVSEDFGDTRVITVEDDRIDAVVAIQFKDQMRDMTTEGPTRILLDLSKVMFLDSSGLGAVVAAMKQVGAGRKLELAGLSPKVKKVFTLTRMDTVFTIHLDVNSAMGGLANAG